jgi:hypothetical protein
MTFAAMTLAPDMPVPSIASSAMLVELSISTWTGRKKDRDAQESVEVAAHAQRGVANVVKRLMADNPELASVQKYAANTRNLHYALTMPWSDTGLRLLPTAQYFKYHETMTKADGEYWKLVTEFMDGYEFEIVAVQAKLGDLFNRNDYPTVSALTNKFGFRLNYIPLPDAGDFRLDINTEAVSELRTHYNDFYKRQLETAMADIWRRTYEALERMSERLDDPEPGFEGTVTKKGHKKFNDSLVENVMEIVDLLKTCNVTQDVQMEAMRARLADALMGVTPDALREDRHFRLNTKRQIDEAIKALPSLDF